MNIRNKEHRTDNMNKPELPQNRKSPEIFRLTQAASLKLGFAGTALRFGYTATCWTGRLMTVLGISSTCLADNFFAIKGGTCDLLTSPVDSGFNSVLQNS